MFKFLHAADIHLDSPLRGLERYESAPVDAIRGATRRAFANLVDLAVDEGVAFVLVAGDLYDGDWKDYNTGLFFSGQMGRLHEAGIPVYVVAGNHDAASQLTRALRPPPNVHVFATAAPETVRIESLAVALHGQGYPRREVTEDLSRRYPRALPDYFNIGLLHTSLEGRPGHEPYAPCTVAALQSHGYQYWALGHVHQREEVARDPWIVYPGNLQGRHARETGPKGCTLVTVDAGMVADLEHRALDVVRWDVATVDVAGCDDFDHLYARIHEALTRCIDAAEDRLAAVRLRLVGASAWHDRLHESRERVTNECRNLAVTLGGDALWLERVELATRRASSLAAALASDDAYGGLLRAIDALEADDASLAALAVELGELASRLPPALRAGPDAFDPNDPALLRDALEDVKAALLARLLERRPDA